MLVVVGEVTFGGAMQVSRGSTNNSNRMHKTDRVDDIRETYKIEPMMYPHSQGVTYDALVRKKCLRSGNGQMVS